MAILTLDEYKKKQHEQTPIKYTQGMNKSSILTFDEYKKTNDYQMLKSTYKGNLSTNALENYKKRKKELETQLLNYKREEANPWWDKNDNVVENVGNVFHKLFFEKPEDRYKKDEQYDALEKEYADINKKIDDYLVENKTYNKGLLGYAQKSADVTAGNVRTSVDGINSTILKATGQKPVVYDSYAERIGNKAISQSKGAEKVGLEITGSVARMVPQMIMPTKKASYVMGFANYGGSAYNQAIKEGYDDDKATLYGVTIGGLEMGLQGLLGGLDDIYGSSIAGRATDKIMRKIISNPTVRSYITKVGGEFTEEYLQEFLNPIVRNVILEEENGANFWNQAGMENKIKQFAKNFFNEQNLYAGALGGLTSGIMDSPALFVNKTNSNSVSTKPTVPTVQEIIAQEKNSATVSNANIPRLTPETSSGTSSFNEETIFPTNDALIASNRTSETDGTLVSSIANNIAQSNETVKLPITSETNQNIASNTNDKFDNKYDFDYNTNQNINYERNAKFKNKTLNSIVFSKQVETSTTDFAVRDANYYYLINNAKDGFYDIAFRVKIEGNEDYLNYLDSKRGEENVNTIRRESVGNNENSQSRLGNDSGNNVDAKREQSWSKYIDEVLERYQSQRIESKYNSEESNANSIGELNNSSFSSSAKQEVKVPLLTADKILNPNEISKISLEDANTTPILPNKEVSTGRGESHFAKNIENKTNMLSKESKAEILDETEVNYYQEITNKGSLEKAFKRLNEGGKSETLNWFNKDSTKATDVDVAEGWILLKQYQDKIQNTTDLATKDELNRSMVQVAKKMREMGTKAGQTVQAYNILNRLTPEGMVYYAQSELSEAFEIMSKNKTAEWIDNNREQFNLTPQETEFIMKTMQEVQQMEDGYNKKAKLGEIQSLMTDKLPPSKGSGIKAWMRISMLFNPKTQVRNVMGNAIIAPVNWFGDLFASAIDKQIAKKTGVRTTGTTDAKSYAKGFKEGAFQAYNDLKKGINTRNIQGNRFEINEGKSFNNNNTMGKVLNRVDSILSFMLDIGDRTFYEGTFTNSINNQLKLNNTTEVTQDMIDIATTEALSRTWQDNNGYTRFVLNVRKGLNALNIGGYGLGDVLIPFAKTPANLTKAIVDYSPAGMIKAINEGINLNRSLSNGQYNVQMQHKFVQDLGKATAGTMLYILGIALAKVGITTGESDDDKDVANFLKNTLGISSYSIKIGNKSFSYDWAQPIAAPLAMTANMVKKQKEGVTLYENIVSTLDTGLNVLFEQSFLESMSNVLSESGEIGTKLIEQFLELPSRAVPTLFKQIADLIDPVQRQTFEYGKPLETAINKVKAKVPILSKTLAPSVDTIGREIQKYGGKNNIFNVFLNPVNVNTENISKSASEIYRLYKSTGETNIMPRVAPYYINQDGVKISLNSSQREKYQKASGKIIEDNIDKLLKTSEYKNMSDKEKAEVINGIVNYSYNIAKKEVLDIELSNAYEKAYEYSKIGDISDYYSFKASIDDTNKDTKRTSITNYLTNSKLDNKQLAFLYGSYYSSKETLNSLLDANIPIKEFIKFNSQEFTTDYYTNGKAIANSRKLKVIKYVNSLNLSVAQKAILIKMEYSSYDKYDNQIVSYINKMNYTKFEKASLLKSFGFDYYDKYLIQYVNKMNITKAEKEEMLKEMGFTIRNGKVYS